MQRWSKKSVYGASTALVLTLATVTARADVVLPVLNLDFNQLGNNTLSNANPKDFFTTVAPTDWNVGVNGGQNGNLTFVGQQGAEGSNSSGTYGVYTNPGFSVTVPAGTNFFQADGNPTFEDTIYQKIPGLKAGTTYDLQFQQAAGQQNSPDFTLPTEEQWKVFLGVGGIGTTCSSSPCTVTGTANNIEDDSTEMDDQGEQNVNWQSVNMTFTPTIADLGGATTGSAFLTFLAWGDHGDTANEPPTVFLEGVNTTPIPAPEPATMSLLGVGLVGLGAITRRRRGKSSKAS